VTEDRARAVAWAERCLAGDFGGAGSTVVVEEYLAGPELSVFAVCDGTDAVLLQPARDYKRLGDGDSGPNTGGMGSYSPVALEDGLLDRVRAEVFLPTLARMAEDGHPYRGFLYAGLILTDRGPQVIEFNVRLGDPETQVVLPRLDSDLVDVIEKALGSGVSALDLEWSPMAAVDVVLASHGYPESSDPGVPIHGADIEAEDLLVFHAGTSQQGKLLMTDGGRVLSVVGLGPDLPAAAARAYSAVDAIDYVGKTFRTDIAGHIR
jgi:phosphoribosylamine--glycine ligase